jgi:hypothetical protein
MWHIPIILPRDLYLLIEVFLVYNVYLFMIGTNILEVYRETADSLENNGNRTPFYRFIHWIYRF